MMTHHQQHQREGKTMGDNPVVKRIREMWEESPLAVVVAGSTLLVAIARLSEAHTVAKNGRAFRREIKFRIKHWY